MDSTQLTVSDDAEAVEWIAEKGATAPFQYGAAVGYILPSGYEAYARILHPVELRDSDPDGVGQKLACWEDAAQATGRTMHPTVQWHRLMGSDDSYCTSCPEWPGGHPPRGRLEHGALASLLETLESHTRTPNDCWFGLWEGYGGLDEIEELQDAHPLNFAGRDSYLLRGSLSAALAVDKSPFHPLIRQSPNSFWPEDRAWFVATEIDFDSTLVGGSEALIRDVLANHRLEAFRFGLNDSLTSTGDAIN